MKSSDRAVIPVDIVRRHASQNKLTFKKKRICSKRKGPLLAGLAMVLQNDEPSRRYPNS